MVKPMTGEIKDHLIPVSRENLNDKITAQIKALILSKGIPIGQRLPPERELALHFKVSRTVVRQALKSLEQSGLVEIRTGATGGAFVQANHYMPLFSLSYDLFNAGELRSVPISMRRERPLSAPPSGWPPRRRRLPKSSTFARSMPG